MELNGGQEILLNGDQQIIVNGNQEITDQHITLHDGEKYILNGQITLNDGQITLNGDQKITLNGSQKITLNTGQKIILNDNKEVTLNESQTIMLKEGQKFILNEITLNSDQEIELNAGQKITLKAGQKITNGNQDISVNSDEEITLNAGQKITLNADQEVTTLSTATLNDVGEIKLKINQDVSLALIAGNGQNQNQDTNQRTIWIVTGLMFAPLFSIASHSGYILAAWVTEPAKTTAAFLLALSSFLYMFFMFRQCYIVHKDDSTGLFAACCEDSEEDPEADSTDSCCNNCKHQETYATYEYSDKVDCSRDCCCCMENLKSCYACFIECCMYSKSSCTCKTYWIYFLIFFPIWAFFSHLINVCYVICYQICSEKGDQPKSFKIEEDKDTEFSIRGFFLSCSWGWLIVGVLVFIFSAFFLLPLPTFQLAEYLESAIQLLIVVLAFMITYKVFTSDDVDEKIKKYFNAYRSKNTDEETLSMA